VLVTLALFLLQSGSAPSLADDLERAVDLPDPAARAQAALALARREDVFLERWLEAARGFGRFAPAGAGTHEERVELEVGLAAAEPTSLWVHVPAAYAPGTPAPLLVALHGTGGSGEDALLPWVATAESLGMLLLAPSEAGENAGYAYTDRERSSVLAALRWMRRHFDVDENRVHLTGSSRGGHLAWDLALRHPDLFASLAPMTGGPRLEIAESRNNLSYLEGIAHLSIRDLQGSGDDPLLLFNLHLAFELLEAWKAPDCELLEFADLGHDFDMGAVEWPSFFARAARDPGRARVVVCSAGTGRGRSGWAEILETSKEVCETFAPEVNAARWSRLSSEEQRRELQRMVDERTARLEVAREAPGRITARGKGVARFRLLLASAMLPEKGPIRVDSGAKSRTRTPERSAEVLLGDFVERFDRTFLPVAELTVP